MALQLANAPADIFPAGIGFFCGRVYLFPVNHGKTLEKTSTTGMLDEPSLSRQWVARRLQRALSVERWGAPLRAGLARTGGERGRTLGEHGENAAQRARALEALIRSIGSEPYGSWGVGAPLTRAAATLVARTSTTVTRRVSLLMAEHTLSEYSALEALVQKAPGVPEDLFDALTPMHDESEREFRQLADAREARA